MLWSSGVLFFWVGKGRESVTLSHADTVDREGGWVSFCFVSCMVLEQSAIEILCQNGRAHS